MRATAIIPFHPSHRDSLPRTLASLKRAAEGLDVETLVIEDGESRGPSWARNRGLEKATGEAVFFIDADDTVRPDYFRRHLELIEKSNADFVLSSLALSPLKRTYDLDGNAAIRAALLPAYCGYSFDDVRRWNAGGRLDERREFGTVWHAAFRRDFLERHHIRFDETLRLYEDAPFLAECAAFAERVRSMPDILYDYTPGPHGLQSLFGSNRYYDYKFAALANRKALATRAGADILQHFRGSAVFSTLELLRAGKDWRRYANDPFVADALRHFPISLRHPLAALAVLTARISK